MTEEYCGKKFAVGSQTNQDIYMYTSSYMHIYIYTYAYIPLQVYQELVLRRAKRVDQHSIYTPF